METKDKVKILTSKDEKNAQKMADELVNNSDITMLENLFSRMDFLFPFVVDNVKRRIFNAFNEQNFKNIYNFLDIYNENFEDVFAQILSNFSDKNVFQKMSELLKNGTDNNKIYAISYFLNINNNEFAEEISKYAFCCENDNLKRISRAYLGFIKDKKSYDNAVEMLKSDDDFSVLESINFFIDYGSNPPINILLDACEKSSMKENIAGLIQYIKPYSELIFSEYKDKILNFYELALCGLGEIISLEEIFSLEIYEILNILKNDNSPNASAVMLRAKLKFDELNSNEEYTFDASRDVKEEIKNISSFLKSFNVDFWENKKKILTNRLKTDNEIQLFSTLELIRDIEYKQAIPYVVDLIYETSNQTMICDCLNTLKMLNAIDKIDKDYVFSVIDDNNLKEIAKNCFI